jgi:hypothetical protein
LKGIKLRKSPSSLAGYISFRNRKMEVFIGVWFYLLFATKVIYW